MKHCFYTDPLAAAWMSKHFGMTFTTFARNGGLKHQSVHSMALHATYASSLNYRYYIHPDSLHRLTPQVGDVIEGANDLKVVGKVIDIGFDRMLTLDTYAGNFGTYDCNKIIERDGQPFFWPEDEQEKPRQAFHPDGVVGLI